jgi:hypothetical protein
MVFSYFPESSTRNCSTFSLEGEYLSKPIDGVRVLRYGGHLNTPSACYILGAVSDFVIEGEGGVKNGNS